MPEVSSKADIVTWLITVKHPWQSETPDHWDNPSQYPFMREVLHETVHFWQAIGTPYFMKVSFDAYKDLQRVRATACAQGEDRPLPADRLVLEPNRFYFTSYHRLGRAYGEAHLSATDLIEGLARYWDVHLCGIRAALERIEAEGRATHAEMQDAQTSRGPFFLPDGLHYTHSAVRFVFEVESRYNRAYAFALDTIGEEAFILFPVIGFLALSRGSQSVSTFQRWTRFYAENRPFEIPPGNFLLAWDQCWSDAFRWVIQDLEEPLYSSLTAYRHRGKKMIGWSLGSPLAERFGIMAGHGILDRYMQTYWTWLRDSNPGVAEEDIELRLHPAFALPGNPAYRAPLIRWFHPPVIQFEDGRAWVDQTHWTDLGGRLESELVGFAGMLGAAVALSGEFGPELPVGCPHTGCPWHRTRLCWKVPEYPTEAEACGMPGLYREQMNLDLPEDPGWHAGMIDRPIAQELDEFLNLETD